MPPHEFLILYSSYVSLWHVFSGRGLINLEYVSVCRLMECLFKLMAFRAS